MDNYYKETAISVKGLTIRYRNIHKFSIKRQLLKHDFKQSDYFEAVHGIDFEIEKGKIVGLIGKNGSGKSTTLLALAGVFCADEGTIDLHGHSISLMAIGVGFRKELTGRENILLSGMLLGFTKEQVLEKESEIIDFAEMGSFIDKPVSTYSSGMYSKLAFAITAILETDIMLIDEVLSVGDIKFKKKSFQKMKELINQESRTVIIVSHNMDTLRSLCDEIIWLHDGSIKKIGEPDEVLSAYAEFMK